MIIKNATIIQNGLEVITDVIIENENSGELDAQGCYLLNGLVDLNIRPCDEQISASSLKNISSSAIKGGVTTAVLMSDLNPSVSNEIVLDYIHSRSKLHSGAKIETVLDSVNEEEKLSDIASLLKNGAVAPYLITTLDNNLTRRVFEYAKMYNVPIFCQPLDVDLNADGVMHEGKVSARLGLSGISPVAEAVQVAMMIEFSREFNVEVLFKSISTKRAIELIFDARENGVRVKSEVSLHHLVLTDEMCDNFNTYAKIYPPLRDTETKEFLLEALKSGKIDILTSLQSERSVVFKEVSFFEAKFGTESIEDILPLYYTHLVKSGIIDMAELLRLTSVNPSNILNFKSSDFILFNPNVSYKIENSHSLYNNQEIFGCVEKVWIEGEEVGV